MKLLAIFSILSATAFAVDNNAYVFYDRNEKGQGTIFMEWDGHYWEIGFPNHSSYCPCLEED
jgi:hypothetical protein